MCLVDCVASSQCNMAEDCLQLFVAQTCLSYVPRQFEVAFMQLLESSARHYYDNTSNDQLMILCHTMVLGIKNGKPKKLLQFFHNAENVNEESDDDADDDDDEYENGSNSSDIRPIVIEYVSYDELKDAVSKANDMYTGNNWNTGNTSTPLTPVVQLLGDENNIQLLISIDDRIDDQKLLRRKIMTAFGETIRFDTNICEEDSYALNMQQLAGMISQEEFYEMTKPCFYPLQEFAAEQLVRRIRFILKQYHPLNVDLEFFDSFDFRIYTAKSKMLEMQTIERLCEKAADCFSSQLYNCTENLRNYAEKRVRMYVVTQKTKKELDELKKEAEDNPNKLFLIIADEAHWGTSDVGLSGNNANNSFVNMWTNANYNVIVLLVTATPWNLLTNRSRIPAIYVADNKDDTCPFTVIDALGRRTWRTSGGQDVTAEVGTVKELHVMKWHESIDTSLKRGLLVTLRMPLKSRESPLWLTAENECSGPVPGLYRWVGSHNSDDAEELLLRTNNNGHVSVMTVDNRKVLAVVNNLMVGFVKNPTRNGNFKSLITDFEVVYEFLENLMEFKPVMKNKYLMFKSTATADTKGYYGSVVLEDSPRDDKKTCGLQMTYHKLGYTFLIEKQRQSSGVVDQLQYLSLNFYFNSMRNQKSENQLIRDDECFRKMATRIVAVHHCDIDDVLAAEYAYYIVIINHVRSSVSTCFAEFFNRIAEYIENKTS